MHVCLYLCLYSTLRFTAEKKGKRPSLTHMPFGWGPRNCIGMRFALMEAKLAFISVLSKYKFVRAPETEVYVHVLMRDEMYMRAHQYRGVL